MITELLDVGVDKAKKNELIASRLGVNTRDVSEIVRIERLQGSPICANCYGYYMPESIDDLKRTRSRLFKQAREVRKVAFAIDDTVKKMEMMQKSREDLEFAEILSKIIDKWEEKKDAAPVDNSDLFEGGDIDE